MAEVISCTANRGISIEALFASLYGVIPGTGIAPLRTRQKTIATDPTVITCASKQDILNLLQQCIHIHTDGLPVLNCITVNDPHLHHIPCATNIADDPWLVMALQFVATNDGEVALYIANLT